METVYIKKIHKKTSFRLETLRMKQTYTTKNTLESDSYSVLWFQFCGKPEEKNASSLHFGVNVRFLQGVRLTAMK